MKWKPDKTETFKHEFWGVGGGGWAVGLTQFRRLFTDTPGFGSSDFTEDNYCLYSEGEFEDVGMEYQLYERNTRVADEIGPEWLLIFGWSTYEIVALDSTFAMIEFFTNFKTLRKE